MEYIEDFERFLSARHVRDILIGQSGARVCEISGDRVAKLIQRRKLAEEGLWERYTREAAFYTHVKEKKLSFVPRMLFVGCNEDEMLLVMEKYSPIERSRISEKLLDHVAHILAQIHALPVPLFIEQTERKPLVYTEKEIADCVKGWESVLNEHWDAFSTEVLRHMARDINKLNQTFHSTRSNFIHGDFHFDNLMLDGEGKVVVCDWQGCGCGDPSGDLSFLISRLQADGYPLNAEWLVNVYCQYANALGLDVSPRQVHMQMRLANLNTSFLYWHMYLHNTSEDRVRGVFGKMTEDYQSLASACG